MEAANMNREGREKKPSAYLSVCVCVCLLLTTSPNCSLAQRSFMEILNECTTSTVRAFLSNGTVSCACPAFFVQHGFAGKCNNTKTLKALHPVIQTTIAFPLLQGVSTEL